MRRCTTVPGFGTCCRAAQAGQLNQPIRVPTAHGERCGMCSIVQKRKGGQGFHFRFMRAASCGMGPGGCPALAGGQTSLLPPGGVMALGPGGSIFAR